MKRLVMFAAAFAIAAPVYAQTVATVNGKAITQ
ncbi:MAG: peptidylprolyl isomerase, partial [Pusillimonas sp.]